ncbi:reverse transcriptase domain-containing protein [Streptococcus agalactiae]|uniref:reverse transcriptase domain-containing protein n=1 Tax=Streptococcus agalactiae TaxID=1311 RepID=UPI00085CD3D9|nr:reverse transcriptase/maturase family protein [Streptococcus agalactiae]
MKPTTEILARISQNSLANKEEVFTKLYRYLLRPDIYFVAYKNLYANNGAATKGVNEDTADGFSEAKIDSIIKALADETYQPMPVRRTYIQKKNNRKKLRPLGIPTFTDKLVQEVLRMILEAVYEPIFLDVSHGFRPKRSCHTALKQLRREFNGTRWFVEGDIKGCFDNINHAVLVGLLSNKIRDARITKLIYKFLKAGYLENWQYHKTYSGTPQGGIISPLLANIYLHELDKFVMKLKSEFDTPGVGQITPEYRELHNEIKRLSHRLTKVTGEEREMVLAEYKPKRQKLMTIPCTAQTDKKLKYVRYADDFLIAVKGNREDCQWIKSKLAEFIGDTLKMELSEDKTLITHSSKCARFLGYDVRVRRSGKIKRGGPGHVKMRTLNGGVELLVPLNDKIRQFVFTKGVAIQKEDGSMFPIHRKYLVGLTDLEIVSVYNAELRGICSYYGMASNFCKLHYFSYLMEYSCLKTLASKHKTSLSKIIDKCNDGTGKWGVPYETKLGSKRRYFANYADCKGKGSATDYISNAAVVYGYAVNTLENRLKAKVCELCGTTESDHYEVHHINKLKNLKGKERWEIAMIAKHRKTLVVCRDCHRSIIHKK